MEAAQAEINDCASNHSNEQVQQYLVKFEEKLEAEIKKISAKFEAQIAAYERKGINPLTKKLMEKARNEQSKAITLKREELETEKMRNVDKIKAGLVEDTLDSLI